MSKLIKYKCAVLLCFTIVAIPTLANDRPVSTQAILETQSSSMKHLQQLLTHLFSKVISTDKPVNQSVTIEGSVGGEEDEDHDPEG